MRVLVTGAGGFIGHHLTKALVHRGYWVRGVDVKYPEYEPTSAHEFELLDLRRWDNCLTATQRVDEVFHLAADMGGIGYLTTNRAAIAQGNMLISAHMLEASRLSGVSRFLFSSSACVYPQYRQGSPNIVPLREEDAYPADPEAGYGWEKLFTEKLCQYYLEDYGLETRVARFHNVYGPLGAFDGGREKAPAAMCRKIALAQDGDEIEIWGDGRQTRTFMYVGDCIEGIWRIMRSKHSAPLNLGTDRLVSVDELVQLVARIAGKSVRERYVLTKPQGVRGRSSDNSRLRQVLGWEPQVPLEEGLRATYLWIEGELRTSRRPNATLACTAGIR